MMIDDVLTLTDSTYQETINGDKPVLILCTDGEGLRGDFTTAFKKAVSASPNILFARLNPQQNPQAREHFCAGSKPVIVGYYQGKEVVRRNRPWGTDVPAAVDLLKSAVSQQQAQSVTQKAAVTNNIDNTEQSKEKKVNEFTFEATDENFQTEVIDYEKPVLVDFWAEWCGPCRMVGPILDKLAEEFKDDIRVAKVDVDANPGLAQHFQVMSIPTIMLLKERHIVFKQPGALPEPAFRDLIQQLIALEIPHEGHTHDEDGVHEDEEAEIEEN